MSTTLRRRLERLELQHQGSMDEVQQAALQAISDEDLNTLAAFIERGAPFVGAHAGGTGGPGAVWCRMPGSSAANSWSTAVQAWTSIM